MTARLHLLPPLDLADPAAWPSAAETAHLRGAPLPVVRSRRPLPLGEERAVWGECVMPVFVVDGGEG